MSQIRRQSILSTIFVYAGFLIGFVNTFLFTRQASPFTPAEYGLTGIFIAVGNLMFAFSNMGMISVLYKFHPYYADRLEKRKNDLLTWALLVCLAGFVIVCAFGILFKGLVLQKFGENSIIFVQYYFWVFPFGFFLLIFYLLEVFAWNLRKSVITNGLRELGVKFTTLVLMLLLSIKVIPTFDVFIKLYAFLYGLTSIFLIIYLVRQKALYFTLTVSTVTRKLWKKIVSYASLIYLSNVVFMVAQFIDTIVIMSLVGVVGVAIFTLASAIVGLVQAPQRGAIAASLPVLSSAWKEKDYEKISLIYKRSSINLLLASLGLFSLIFLNFSDAVITFNLKPQYLDAKYVFLFLGLARIVDLGSGVNSQIIFTSKFWKYEFQSGMILLTVIIPLTYFAVKYFGLIGAGLSNLVAFTVYNLIRINFLKRKFNMHPFSRKTLYAIIYAFSCYALCYFAGRSIHGFTGIFLKSLSFCLLYGGCIIVFNLTPDALPVIQNIRRRIGLGS